MGLHLAFLSWFSNEMHAGFRSLSLAEREGRCQFAALGLASTAYVLVLPVAVLVAALVSPWVRQLVVEITLEASNLLIYSVLALLIWPMFADGKEEGTAEEKRELRASKEKEKEKERGVELSRMAPAADLEEDSLVGVTFLERHVYLHWGAGDERRGAPA